MIPSPNGTTARPIWNRSRPLVAASVSRVPSRSSRYSDDTLAPERVARPVDDGLEQLLPRLGGRDDAQQLVEEAQLRDRVLGAGRRRRVPVPPARGACAGVLDPGHRHHRTSLGRTATEIGCGRVPGGCPCSRTETLLGWRSNRASSILSPWPTALPDRLGPRPARGGPGSRPPRPSPRDPEWAVPATRSRTRCGSSARCWARSSRSRPGRTCSPLVERIRRRTIALRRGDPEVVLEPDIERERLGRGDRVAGRRARRGRRPRVHPLLPARQPRRGAAADPDAAHAGAPGEGPPDRRVHRRGRGAARRRHGPRGARGEAAIGRGATRCSRRTRRRPGDGRCSSRCAGSGGCSTRSTTR